ncbi:MAG: hypothetical protein KY461_08900 [Actinobacteria bacterium]|nr:hypothetical protein [Actinomycetota bacterium]
MSAEACGPEGCGDCSLACARSEAPGSGRAGADLAVVGAAGVVVALLAGVLALGAPGWVATLAGVTAGAGIALAGVAHVARTSSRAGLGDGVAVLPVRVLPFVTAAFLATVLARAGAALLA